MIELFENLFHNPDRIGTLQNNKVFQASFGIRTQAENINDFQVFARELPPRAPNHKINLMKIEHDLTS